MREKQSGIPILIKTRFYGDLGIVLRVILGAKIDETTLQIRWILEGFWGGPPESVHPPVEGNGRIQGGQPVSHIIDILDILEQEDSKADKGWI